MLFRFALVSFFWCVCHFSVTAVLAETPMTGKTKSEFAEIDKAIQSHLKLMDATAAALAITIDGELVVSRGYGWSDENRKQPTTPNTVFRLASNSKPFTVALVKSLIRDKKISGDLKVFPYLGIESYNGEVGDARLVNITVQHLLDHQGGWDRSMTFPPMYKMKAIQKEIEKITPVEKFTPQHLISYMLAQPLQFAPGERSAYSNFGYFVLGRVIEKATGKSYDEFLAEQIARPLGVTDLGVFPKKHPNETHYPRDNGFDMSLRDSSGGLASSATTLCLFMNRYWMNGDLRNRDSSKKRHYIHFGSLPYTTIALMEQRPDGIDFALLFNARRNEHSAEDLDSIHDEVNRVLDEIEH